MSPTPYQRWYDKDPALRQAMDTLRQAPDAYQAQIALNIILIIVEHQIEAETLSNVDDLVHTLADSQRQDKDHCRRWYDLNETLRSAMQLLKDCPEELQHRVVPSIAKMIENSLEKIG